MIRAPEGGRQFPIFGIENSPGIQYRIYLTSIVGRGDCFGLGHFPRVHEWLVEQWSSGGGCVQDAWKCYSD
jgi:hypothetical protein